ncbi:MAG: hypothetical protein ACM3RP_04280 [Chitinophagales bacterium]
MRASLAHSFTPLRDGFTADLARLTVVTVLVLSLLAAATAWAVDAFFGRTVSGLVGRAGENDFVLYVRSDSKSRAEQRLATYLPKTFPGATFKPGLTVAGQANFFVTLPEAYRTRSVMENIDSTFGSLPGYSGHLLLIEPSIFVHGIPAGAYRFFLDKFQDLPGVKLTFASGQDLVVALQKGGRPEDVEPLIKKVLSQYRVVEARFPMGYKVSDLDRVGAQAAAAAQASLKVPVTDVTQSDKQDDYSSFLGALVEMRRFLLSYASDITIKLGPAASLRKGDELVAGAGLTQGGRIGDQALRILVTGVDGDVAHGVAVQGDTTPPGGAKAAKAAADGRGTLIPAGMAYRARPNNRVGAPVGPATIHNQRYALMATVDESVKLLSQLQLLAKHADTTAARVQLTLDSFQQTMNRMTEVQSALDGVKRGLAGPLDGLGKVQTDSLVAVLNKTVGAIDDLLDRMNGVTDAKAAMDLAAGAAHLPPGTDAGGGAEAAAGLGAQGAGLPGQAGASAAELQAQMAGLSSTAAQQTDALSQIIGNLNPVSLLLLKWRAQVQTTALQVQNFGLLAKNAGAVNEFIDGLSGATDTTVAEMQKVDVTGLKSSLQEISQRLEAIARIDVGSVTKQMTYVKDSLPNVKDDQLGRSVRLIDRYIGGEVIPGERLQFLVPGSVPAQAATAAVKKAVGDNASVSVLPSGSLKPDLQGLLFQLLGKVRSTVAGLIALGLVMATLVLDHAVVIATLSSAARGRRSAMVAGVVYGGVAGATLLGSVFLLSGAGFPLLGWPGVFALGAGLGMFVAVLARRLAPVNLGELEAGEAMGLSYARILREIIIPEGRPGLLLLLNRSSMLFPREARQA